MRKVVERLVEYSGYSPPRKAGSTYITNMKIKTKTKLDLLSWLLLLPRVGPPMLKVKLFKKRGTVGSGQGSGRRY
jgi:hypothetical protein